MKTEAPLGAYTLDNADVPARGFATPPPALTEKDGEGRLRHDLREVAKKYRPEVALAEASRWMAKVGPGSESGRALASLAATGRRANRELIALEAAGGLRDKVRAELGPNATTGELKQVDAAIHHARVVRDWLKAPAAQRAGHWAAVGALYPKGTRPYVAVSGEDDLPWVPVNVGRGERTEGHVAVTFKFDKALKQKLTLTVRYAWSGDLDDPEAGPVVLCLHGLGSRLEETELLSKELATKGVGTIAVDLPNHGYSERVPFHLLGTDMATTGTRDGAAYSLDAMESFVDAFATEMVKRHPALDGRLVAVAGGSLGGSLSLRLSKRAPKWLKRAIAWSPGNAWRSFWHGDNFHLAAITASSIGLQPIELMARSEAAGSRNEYIHFAFDAKLPTTEHPYWHTWWRSGVNDDFVASRAERALDARALRHEVYDEWHRRWCCALAHDQLAVTMRGADEDKFGKWPFDKVKVPLLLMAGDHDDYPFASIFSATKLLAARAAKQGATGSARFFTNTGHSIHDERPRMLGQNVAEFVKASGPFR